MQTIGERLEEARKKKGISIREAAEATKIRGDYLQKFEGNHFDIGLTEIYTRGFLRTYANFLKLPADRLLSDYAALGRGDTRPRQPNREVYGRMDITVATAGESSERATPPADGAAGGEAPRAQPRYPRSGSSLPSGPDPALIFKYAKWAGAALVLLLLILLVKSCFSGRKAEHEAQQAARPPTLQPAEERTITLIALDSVQVKVLRRNADDTEGDELFNGTLARGQTRVVPWPGPIYIRASAGENLQVEFKGKRYPTGFTGNNRAKM